jgi:hypothetical protein
VNAMRTIAALIALTGVLSGCNTAINMGANLGGQIVLDLVGGAIRSNSEPDYPRSPGTSRLVCNPVGEKVVDPTTECHAETE